MNKKLMRTDVFTSKSRMKLNNGTYERRAMMSVFAKQTFNNSRIRSFL